MAGLARAFLFSKDRQELAGACVCASSPRSASAIDSKITYRQGTNSFSLSFIGIMSVKRRLNTACTHTHATHIRPHNASRVASFSSSSSSPLHHLRQRGRRGISAFGWRARLQNAGSRQRPAFPPLSLSSPVRPGQPAGRGMGSIDASSPASDLPIDDQHIHEQQLCLCREAQQSPRWAMPMRVTVALALAQSTPAQRSGSFFSRRMHACGTFLFSLLYCRATALFQKEPFCASAFISPSAPAAGLAFLYHPSFLPSSLLIMICR